MLCAELVVVVAVRAVEADAQLRAELSPYDCWMLDGAGGTIFFVLCSLGLLGHESLE